MTAVVLSPLACARNDNAAILKQARATSVATDAALVFQGRVVLVASQSSVQGDDGRKRFLDGHSDINHRRSGSQQYQ